MQNKKEMKTDNKKNKTDNKKVKLDEKKIIGVAILVILILLFLLLFVTPMLKRHMSGSRVNNTQVSKTKKNSKKEDKDKEENIDDENNEDESNKENPQATNTPNTNKKSVSGSNKSGSNTSNHSGGSSNTNNSNHSSGTNSGGTQAKPTPRPNIASVSRGGAETSGVSVTQNGTNIVVRGRMAAKTPLSGQGIHTGYYVQFHFLAPATYTAAEIANSYVSFPYSGAVYHNFIEGYSNGRPYFNCTQEFTTGRTVQVKVNWGIGEVTYTIRFEVTDENGNNIV